MISVPEQIRAVKLGTKADIFGYEPENDLGFTKVLGPSVAL